jgi:hypothetical protein
VGLTFFEDLSYFCAVMKGAFMHSFFRFSTIIMLLLLLLSTPSCSVYLLCPVQGCQVRLLHAHSGVTYRGQPWWRVKRQNPKVGQEYIFTKKDKNLIKIDNWFTRTFGKKPDKKDGESQGNKTRGSDGENSGKDFDTEQPEEDKEEKEGE